MVEIGIDLFFRFSQTCILTSKNLEYFVMKQQSILALKVLINLLVQIFAKFCKVIKDEEVIVIEVM